MNVEIGTETPIFLSGNICFEISVFCLCSVLQFLKLYVMMKMGRDQFFKFYVMTKTRKLVFTVGKMSHIMFRV
jgi:hypothetical protein